MRKIAKCIRCLEIKEIAGKSHCVKCYQLLHGKRFSNKERLGQRNYIIGNLCVLSGVRDNEKWIVDLDDFEKANKYLWVNNGCGYAQTNLKNRKKLYLHKLICSDFIIVDHIDKDTFNNRKTNLRNGSHGLNQMNKTLNKVALSHERGIHKMRDKWQVRINVSKKRIYLGTFDTIEKAKSELLIYANKNNLQEFYN